MSEMAKTMIFLGVALAAIVGSLATRPQSADLDVQSLVGTLLTKQFSDPDAAKRLRIVRFDEETATLREFEVTEGADRLWTLPSKSGYPADAERQMAEAATSVMDREILAVVGNSAAEHKQYGLIDPLSPKLSVGQEGVGARVTITDLQDKPLVDLILGQEVKDAPDQRYVREANRDVVYIIEIDPSKLSTSFEDWIEPDLLQINPLDIERVEIKDYVAELVPQLVGGGIRIGVRQDQRGQFSLRYDDQESKWVAESLQQLDPESKELVPFELTDEEELNTSALDDLKNALDDLAIVDVVRKPEGLSADLKAGSDFLSRPETARDLMSRGFAPVGAVDKEMEIISTEGQVLCTLKNGVEYVLRFGDLRLDSTGEEKASDEANGEDDTEGKEEMNRYLFVMAQFNEDAVEKPELAELPELPKETEEETEEPAEPSDSEEKEEGEEKEESDSEEGALEKITAERKRLETENERKLDAYKMKLEQGRERVQELNARFGDWYYVISNDIFKKVRLGRDELLTKREKSEEEQDEASDFGTPGAAVPGLPTIPAEAPDN